METGRLKANRNIGQNFLVDPNILRIIIDTASIKTDDVILEIGPGTGALTRELLLANPRYIYAIEIDRRMEPFLDKLPDTEGKLNIFWEDAVRFNYDSGLAQNPTKIVANIPYHISTPLLWNLLAALPSRGLCYMLLMVQKEIAKRFTAPPRTKERNPLGITIDAMGDSRIVRQVSPGSFRPVPRVTSALLEIQPRRQTGLAASPLWRQLVKTGFTRRRRTLVNNLGQDFFGGSRGTVEILQEMGLSATVRAEELETSHWLALYELLKQQPLVQ